MNSNIQVNHHIRQRIFDKNMLENHSLIIYLGQDELSYAVLDDAMNEIVFLKSYRLAAQKSSTEYAHLIKKVLETEENLKGSYVEVNVGISFAQNTLIPLAYYDKTHTKKYFEYNYGISKTAKLFTDTVLAESVINVFALENEIAKTLKAVFPKYSIKHAATFLLNQILGENRDDKVKKMFVNLQKNHVDFVVAEGKKLIFYNQFNFNIADDLLYHLINVAKQTHIDFNLHDCIMLGDIHESHPTYQLCSRYIESLKLGKRPITKNYCKELDILPDNYYFNLFSIL
ncbi:MAG: DUF3822 family protein [Chitinophagales bacterium]